MAHVGKSGVMSVKPIETSLEPEKSSSHTQFAAMRSLRDFLKAIEGSRLERLRPGIQFDLILLFDYLLKILPRPAIARVLSA